MTVASFVDLRAFADQATIPSASGADAWLSARVVLPLPPGPLDVAAIALDDAGTVDAPTRDEVIVVLAGMLSIQTEQTRLTLGPDDYAVVPAGSTFRWQAAPGTNGLVLSYRGAVATGTEPLAIDGEAELEPSSPPSPTLVTSPGTPACRQHVDYRSADGFFYCGTWASTPYTRLPMIYHHSELMQIREGRVTISDETGRRMEARPGDIVLFNQDGECAWDTDVHVCKTFVIYRPA